MCLRIAKVDTGPTGKFLSREQTGGFAHPTLAPDLLRSDALEPQALDTPATEHDRHPLTHHPADPSIVRPRLIADAEEELARQRATIVTALTAIDFGVTSPRGGATVF